MPTPFLPPFQHPTRYASTIRTKRSTPILPTATLRVAMRAGQHSITPRGRILGRGRGQPVRRSLLRLLPRRSVGKRSRNNEDLPSVDEPPRPLDGSADQSDNAVH